jgi:hypothetical protein
MARFSTATQGEPGTGSKTRILFGKLEALGRVS